MPDAAPRKRSMVFCWADRAERARVRPATERWIETWHAARLAVEPGEERRLAPLHRKHHRLVQPRANEAEVCWHLPWRLSPSVASLATNAAP